MCGCGWYIGERLRIPGQDRADSIRDPHTGEQGEGWAVPRLLDGHEQVQCDGLNEDRELLL